MQKYYLIPRYKVLYSIIGALSLVVLAPFIYILWRAPIFNFFLFLLLILITIRSAYWIKNENIAISNEGIEYDTPGMILEIKWENIQGISYCWPSFIRQECLVVDQSHAKIRKWAIYANTYHHPLKNYLQSIAIPLSCFSDNWRDSELGQQIKQYAPHLFENEKSSWHVDKF